MVTLKGNLVYLRALEPEDLDFVHQIENDESIWEISSTQTPYSRFLIRQYLQQAQQDIYQAKQLRLAICASGTEDAIGLIDLFDFDPLHRRAGIGILIQKDMHREQGYGSEALALLINYAFTHLHLHQLYANISTDNQPSLALFAKFGFEKVGVKKQWIFARGSFHDEALFQLIHTP